MPQPGPGIARPGPASLPTVHRIRRFQLYRAAFCAGLHLRPKKYRMYRIQNGSHPPFILSAGLASGLVVGKNGGIASGGPRLSDTVFSARSCPFFIGIQAGKLRDWIGWNFSFFPKPAEGRAGILDRPMVNAPAQDKIGDPWTDRGVAEQTSHGPLDHGFSKVRGTNISPFVKTCRRWVIISEESGWPPIENHFRQRRHRLFPDQDSMFASRCAQKKTWGGGMVRKASVSCPAHRKII